MERKLETPNEVARKYASGLITTKDYQDATGHQPLIIEATGSHINIDLSKAQTGNQIPLSVSDKSILYEPSYLGSKNPFRRDMSVKITLPKPLIK